MLRSVLRRLGGARLLSGFAELLSPGLVTLGGAVAATAVLGVLFGVDGPRVALTFCGLGFAIILASALDARRALSHCTVVRLSFVAHFGALLLLGPVVAMVTAGFGACAQWLASSRRHPAPSSAGRVIVEGAIGIVAMQVASLSYYALGGSVGLFEWPWHALPILGAVSGYSAVTTYGFEIVVPFVARRPTGRAWFASMARSWSNHVVAAGAVTLVVELVGLGRWDALAPVGVALVVGYRVYRAFEEELAEKRRRDRHFESLGYGVSEIDREGTITSWNSAVAVMTGRPADMAIGQSLTATLPGQAVGPLARLVQDAVARQVTPPPTPVVLPAENGSSLVLLVSVVPDADGATLLWEDATERTRTEQSLKRSEERFAAVAEGASDGLWEWDLRSQTMYLSGQWNAMVGLPPSGGYGRPETWFDRVHPEDLGPLKAQLEAHLAGQTGHFEHQHRVRHEDGTYRHVQCSGVAVRGSARRAVRIGGSMTDTTERARVQEQIRESVHRDPLTGLFNRAVFVESLGRRLDEYKARIGRPFAVLYLDLDRFKVVNDSLGHMVGDELLRAVSRRLEGCLRDGDELARLGGDEFALLLRGLVDDSQANAIAFRIQEALGAPFSIGGREVFSSASIGIAFAKTHYENPEDMMRDADTAMYHAKTHGKARHELFDADMHARALDRLGLENDLRHAVKSNAFEMHYQPIVSLVSGECVGFEALIRWKRDGEAVSPATFVPVAEELGLIEPLGTWVLQEACRAFADWQRRFPVRQLEYITVNVSTRQLMQQHFMLIVERAVRAAGLKPCDLRLEITETTLMDNPLVAADVLRDLRNFGVKIYLDDFGTGYSSLSHLHKLPVDALKIDRSFVKSLLLPDRPAIVESILALARTLHTGVVAEGVENEVQARELERLGCRHAQGYLFSRPLSPEAVEAMLIRGEPLRVRMADPAQVDDERSNAAPFTWPAHVPTTASPSPAPMPSHVAPTRDERATPALV